MVVGICISSDVGRPLLVVSMPSDLISESAKSAERFHDALTLKRTVNGVLTGRSTHVASAEAVQFKVQEARG